MKVHGWCTGLALLKTGLASAYCLGEKITTERNPPMASSKEKLYVRSFPYPQFPFVILNFLFSPKHCYKLAVWPPLFCKLY